MTRYASREGLQFHLPCHLENYKVRYSSDTTGLVFEIFIAHDELYFVYSEKRALSRWEKTRSVSEPARYSLFL